MTSTSRPDLLEVAVRAYTQPLEMKGPESVAKREQRIARLLRRREVDNRRPVLFVDTETTTDPALALLFAVYRFCRWEGDRLVCVLEGLVHADHLRRKDRAVLLDYWRAHRLDTAADQTVFDSAPTLQLVSEREFVRLLYDACFERGAARSAVLVGLNLNFDVSRFARSWGRSATRKYANGFTLRLHDGYTNADGGWRESPLFPRYGAKHLSSTKALKGWIAPFSGHVTDVRTLIFALTNAGHSLESGCKAFGIGYTKPSVVYGKVTPELVAYCRADVQATHGLYERVIREFDRHPIPLQASQAYSPASIGKAYLDGMGIQPRLTLQPAFPREHLGIAMSAFYGGRTECRICKVPRLPVAYCDLLSAYTTANSLMGLWDLVIAKRVRLVDATRDVRELVNEIDLDTCLDPQTWLKFPVLVQIRPDGDVLPVRARYRKDTWNIGSNPLYSDEPVWYALPDVIASKLISGRPAKIIRALRLVPAGVQQGLRPIRLRGEIEIDPRENFFKMVVERRHELPDKKSPTGQFLKTLASAAAYGIYAEMVRNELPGKTDTERVLIADWTGEPYEHDEHNPERPGPRFFAPMAAMITAGTRLLLAITERLVTDAGGTWAMMDTDSIAIVSNERGGLIPCPGGPYRDRRGRECIKALSWQQVEEIRDRLRALNPYGGPAGAGSILELEDENFALDRNGKADRTRRSQLYCLAIASKRYCLYNLDGRGRPRLRVATEPDRHPEEDATARTPTVRKRSDHALGYLINPVDPESTGRDWILDGWQWILNSILGVPAPEPTWFDLPALMRYAVTTPALIDHFAGYNDGKPANKQVRPFNFMMVAQQQPTCRDERTGEVIFPAVAGKCALIAPYEPRPERWPHLRWTNHYQPGSTYDTTTDPRRIDDHTVAIRTLRAIFTSYRDHLEAKSLGPDGQSCMADTVGLLVRRPVHAISPLASIGKEMNALEEHLAGLRQTEAERLNTHHRPSRDPHELV